MNPGIVYLVGAGPGDPGLITIKGMECLQIADLVIYDRLSNYRLLDYAPSHCDLKFAGKEPASAGSNQELINEMLIKEARAGKTVVRLKGGDPFIFGRGGEEALALRAAGIPFEIIPGITSAIAVPAYSGIPLTHRGLASSFTIVSGTEDPNKFDPSLDWKALAATPGTLVVLMGWRTLPKIVGSLLKYGRPEATPVSITQWGTWPNQRTLNGTLKTIVNLATEKEFGSPAVVTIGPVVALSESIRWFDIKPLFGTKILITRARRGISALASQLTAHGAAVVEVPAIEVGAIGDYSEFDEALQNIDRYQWVVLASYNAVAVLFDRLKTMRHDARSLGNIKVAAVGAATADALRDHGITPDLVPDTYSSRSLLDAFKGLSISGLKVLIPQADIGLDSLREGLVELGASVHRLTAYRTLKPRGSSSEFKRLFKPDPIDVVLFTSSSAVQNFLELIGPNQKSLLKQVVVATIGPTTSVAVRKNGLQVTLESEEHTIPGLVSTLVKYFQQNPNGGGSIMGGAIDQTGTKQQEVN